MIYDASYVTVPMLPHLEVKRFFQTFRIVASNKTFVIYYSRTIGRGRVIIIGLTHTATELFGCPANKIAKEDFLVSRVIIIFLMPFFGKKHFNGLIE